MRRRLSLLIVAAALVLSGAACGSSTKAAAHPPCVKPPEGIGPDAYGTLQNDDAGKTVCLPAGKQLTVFLKADNVDGPRWSPIQTSDVSVLVPGNIGIMTLVRGVTGGILVGSHTGTARLTSQLPACKPSAPITSGPPPVACGAVQSWSATVVVTAK